METKHDEFKVRDEFYKRAKAKGMTPGDLAAFLADLAKFDHDYSTCVYAVAAAMIAAGDLMARELGITGFQAGCVFWEVATDWQGIKGPARLVKYENMLYPQYAEQFSQTLKPETTTWLRAEAAKLLAGDLSFVHPNVRAHWQNVADGEIPFGYRVSDR